MNKSNLRNRWFILGVFALAATSVLAQSYSIPWFKIAGGGGTSTGGGFTLSGTIGQHDAGARLTGGAYSLVGGYWFGPRPGPDARSAAAHHRPVRPHCRASLLAASLHRLGVATERRR